MTKSAETRRGDIRGKPLIGVLDDDESVRMAVVALLRSVGLGSRAFASGQEFLSGESAVDCLILDLRMRGLSGLEVQQKLKEAGNTVPVIFISAHGDEDARQRALAAGSVGFLAKPFDEAALLDCVRQALAAPR